MEIRTWRERCQDFNDLHIPTNGDIQYAMQSEIDELRNVVSLARDAALEEAALLLEQNARRREERGSITNISRELFKWVDAIRSLKAASLR